MELLIYLLGYGALTFVLVGWHLRRKARKQAAVVATLEQTRLAGLNEPPSLHPVVDPGLCFGSGACARACPEGALGVVNGRATLINASACIGHGACFNACPVQALSLVFGTEKRGVDIPHVDQNFETNVPGVFIAGELGGMGLIRKTAEQGRQAMAAIAKRHGRLKAVTAELDVLIVGAGPAGLSAALSAKHHGLRYRVIEQEDGLGGAVYHYPRHKIAMTAPFRLDLEGTVRLGREITKEALLAFWQKVVQRHGLQIHFQEQFLGLQAQPDGGFQVRTSRGQHGAKSVLLALGRRGTPRKLGVPGEDEPQVVYRLVDPAQYLGQQVLVVGGGDSALEAAIALAEQEDTEATLSYRGEAFSRVKPANRERVAALAREGRLRLLMPSEVLRMEPGQAWLKFQGQEQSVPNQRVIVCAGGELPTPLLKSVGIQFETKFGSA